MFFCSRGYYGSCLFSIEIPFSWVFSFFFMIIRFFYLLAFLGDFGFTLIFTFVFWFCLLDLVNGLYLTSVFISDLLRFGIIFLTVLVFFLMLLSSSFDFFKSNNWLSFLSILTVFFVFLVLVFLCRRFILFYLVFEIAVVPIFIVIIGWGYRINRSQSAVYMFLYTFLFSIPFLFFLLLIYSIGSGIEFPLLFYTTSMGFSGFLFWFMFVLVFIVKLPVFMLHLWLPKAHVEAPLLGSIVLAGVLLKLGGYGIYKRIVFFSSDFSNFSFSLAGFSLMGGCLVAFLCLRQVDLKRLVAYSSIVHISPVFGVFLITGFYGLSGGWIIIFSHGLCSACLFFVLNLSYMKLGRRRYLVNRGGLLFLPFLSFTWLLFCVVNMGFPPSFNFYSELLIVLRVFSFRYYYIFFIFFLMLFRGFYRVILYLFYNHGVKKFMQNLTVISIKDMMVAFFSLFFLFLFVVYMYLVLCLFILVCGIENFIGQFC